MSIPFPIGILGDNAKNTCLQNIWPTLSNCAVTSLMSQLCDLSFFLSRYSVWCVESEAYCHSDGPTKRSIWAQGPMWTKCLTKEIHMSGSQTSRYSVWCVEPEAYCHFHGPTKRSIWALGPMWTKCLTKDWNGFDETSIQIPSVIWTHFDLEKTNHSHIVKMMWSSSSNQERAYSTNWDCSWYHLGDETVWLLHNPSWQAWQTMSHYTTSHVLCTSQGDRNGKLPCSLRGIKIILYYLLMMILFSAFKWMTYIHTYIYIYIYIYTYMFIVNDLIQ